MFLKTLVGLICISECTAFLLQTLGRLVHRHWVSPTLFDNTVELSFFLCASLPIIANEDKCNNKVNQIFKTIVFAICITTVLATNTRTGIIFIFFYVYHWILNDKPKLSPIAIILFLAVLLIIKKDSTIGRFFIISKTFHLIAQKPLLGWGTNGFQAHYMNIQADYFSKNPESSYSMLADNIHHPLNEFLLVAVNYGVISLAIILLLCFVVYKYYIQNKTKKAHTGMAILSCILIYSLFDYPFQFHIAWIFLIYALYLIFESRIRKYQLLTSSMCAAALLTAVIVAINYKDQLIAKREWNNISNELSITDDILSKYETLNKTLEDDPYFLYNYAYVLYEKGKYSLALEKAKSSQKHLADYDLSLLLGDIYEAMEDANHAIAQYTLAYNMCPNRFAPLCAIYDVYKRLDNREMCQKQVNLILKKTIKIPSKETMDYVNYIKAEQIKYNY